MISANVALVGSYDYGEVARSVLIAIAASYAALDLAGRVTAAGGRIRLAWLGGGAVAMGIGIWAMHFKGMLAFELPVPVEYHWPTILASLLVAILASAVALYVASRQKVGTVEALTGSVVMGAGIAGMHYIGMAAMRMPAMTRYSPLLVTCSILLAILVSLTALRMAFGLREETRWSVPRRLGSATVMGGAISAMHYTGMAAASFFPASSPDLSHAVTISSLGNNGIVIVTLIVIVAAMTTSSMDRRRNEEHLRLVIDTTPAMLHSARPDGYVDFFNKRWLDYVGASLEEIEGWRWTSVIHPEDVEDVVGKWRSSVATGRPFEAEARFRRPDGEYRLMLIRKVPLRDEAGSIAKWYGSATDIEDRKRAEDESRRQKELFQKIFENIPVIISFRGQDRRIEMVNPEFERAMGWTLKEIRGQNLDIYAMFFPDPDYRQMALDLLTASTGEWNDLKVSVKDGRVIDVATTFVRLSDGSTLGIGQDITERKRGEVELRESEARFRLVADSAPVMIWMSGTDKLCTYFNKPWLDFTGRSIDQELGNGWAEGVDPEDLQRCLDTYVQAFDRREPFRMEYRLQRHDGEFRWVSDIGVPRFNPDGSFAGYIGSCTDVTEQRRAEGQLRQAQADLARVTRVAAMGELAAAIAHEVNQPLGAVVTNGSASLRWLAGQPPNFDEAREAIERAVREATRASDVIGRIRALLQKGTPQIERLDVNAVIREVLTLADHELLRGGITVRTELAPDVPNVLGDRVQLQQVILNLILNGIDAMSAITHRPRELLIESAKHPEGVLIQVHDSGEGVDPEQADHIFQPFFTTKPQGIGMGLSVGRSIVEAHGGRLWFTPGSSHGVVFQFTVPKADTSDERAA